MHYCRTIELPSAEAEDSARHNDSRSFQEPCPTDKPQDKTLEPWENASREPLETAPLRHSFKMPITTTKLSKNKRADEATRTSVHGTPAARDCHGQRFAPATTWRSSGPGLDPRPPPSLPTPPLIWRSQPTRWSHERRSGNRFPRDWDRPHLEGKLTEGSGTVKRLKKEPKKMVFPAKIEDITGMFGPPPALSSPPCRLFRAEVDPSLPAPNRGSRHAPSLSGRPWLGPLQNRPPCRWSWRV